MSAVRPNKGMTMYCDIIQLSILTSANSCFSAIYSNYLRYFSVFRGNYGRNKNKKYSAFPTVKIHFFALDV